VGMARIAIALGVVLSPSIAKFVLLAGAHRRALAKRGAGMQKTVPVS